MNPDSERNELQALSGLFADTDDKPVVVAAQDVVGRLTEDPLFKIVGFKGGIGLSRLGKPSLSLEQATMAFAESLKNIGVMQETRKIARGFGGAKADLFIYDECEAMLTMGTLRNRPLYIPKMPKDKAAVEAHKTKSRGRLIGRKSW